MRPRLGQPSAARFSVLLEMRIHTESQSAIEYSIHDVRIVGPARLQLALVRQCKMGHEPRKLEPFPNRRGEMVGSPAPSRGETEQFHSTETTRFSVANGEFESNFESSG